MSDKLYSPIIYDPKSKIYYKQELNTHVGIVLNAQQQFVNKLIKQRDQYKAECERLKERNYQLAKINDRLYLDNYNLEQENEKQLELLKDFSKFINYKLIVSPASDTYKHYRSELDKLGVK